MIRYDSVEKLKKRFFNGESYLYNRLWALIVWHQWMEKT
jgi:hypothetical protein